MIKGFRQYITEAMGWSNTIAEYSSLFTDQLRKKLKGSEEQYFQIGILDAKSKVSAEAASELPLNKVLLTAEIIRSQDKPSGYRGTYIRRYDKENITTDSKLNVQVDIQLYATQEQSDEEILDMATESIMHELTHALNDYKEKNADKKYRLGYMNSIVDEYPFIKDMPGLRRFFKLLYGLTDAEIKAMVGAKESFNSDSEFRNYIGTRYADLGRTFDPEEWTELIESEVNDSEFAQHLTTEFGKFIVNTYEAAAPDDIHKDGWIMKMTNLSTPLEVMTAFEPYIKKQSEYLWRKLAKKLSV